MGASSRPIASQGYAFTCNGFSNWKKQHQSVVKRKTSEVHLNAKVVVVLFLQERFITARLKRQNELEAERKKKQIILYRNIMSRIVDKIVFLSGQGVSSRAHPELAKALI